MNIMIAAAGVGRERIMGGSADGAVFIMMLCAAGFVLLTAAHLVMRRYDRPRVPVRWSEYPR